MFGQGPCKAEREFDTRCPVRRRRATSAHPSLQDKYWCLPGRACWTARLFLRFHWLYAPVLAVTVVADEFLFSTQPIFNVVAILPDTRFLQTVDEFESRGLSEPGFEACLAEPRVITRKERSLA